MSLYSAAHAMIFVSVSKHPLMKCLSCKDSELRENRFPDLGNPLVHVCPECEGAWYPEPSLQLLTESSRGDIEQSELAPVLEGDKLEMVDIDSPVFCPVCEKRMSRIAYQLAPDTQLDTCYEHGMWLDYGELGVVLEQLSISQERIAGFREGIADKRKEMGMDSIAIGKQGNVFALTLRLLNRIFAGPKS